MLDVIEKEKLLFAVLAGFHAWIIKTWVKRIKVFGIQFFLNAAQCFSESLEMNHLARPQEFDGICNFRHISHNP